jgi:hypothetical protein
MMNSGVRYLRSGMDLGEKVITAEARHDVWLAWGLLPDHQVALEEKFGRSSIEYSADSRDDVREVPFLHI